MLSVCLERALDYIAAHFRYTLWPHWRDELTRESGVQRGLVYGYSETLDALGLAHWKWALHTAFSCQIFQMDLEELRAGTMARLRCHRDSHYLKEAIWMLLIQLRLTFPALRVSQPVHQGYLFVSLSSCPDLYLQESCTEKLVDDALWHDESEDNPPLRPHSSCTDLGDRI